MTDAYEGWALVEQMGFRRTVARVREVEQFGTKMLRMDVPYWDGSPPPDAPPSGFTTMFAGGPSIYQISPLDEDLATHTARRQSDPRPVRPTSFRIEDKSQEEAPDDDERPF